MCKLMFVAGIKRQHQDKVKKLSHEFLKASAQADNDGFGYAAITNDGQIYGEKWLREEDVFKIHAQPKTPPGNDRVKNLLGEAARPLIIAPTEKVYEDFGVTRTKDVLNSTVAIIVHARKKTTGFKSIENCHPFYSPETPHESGSPDPQTAMVHNGSIMNHHSLTKKTSSCDSEVILHEYLKEGMSYNPWAMPKLAKTLVGQYTVGVLTSAQLEADRVQPVLDIFKSAKELHCAFVKELETYVFCTTPGHLAKACHEAGLTPIGMSEIRDGYLIRLNAITGERLEDIIPFDQSRQYLTGHNYTDYDRRNGGNAHHRPAGIHSRTADLTMVDPNRDYTRQANMHGPSTSESDTVDKAKLEFERHHTDLFQAPYYDTGTGLTKEEMEYFSTLEADSQVNLKALRLVKKVLNF
jgi:predicted glutamine amidotransferase